MATANASSLTTTPEPQALTYQQAMHGLRAIVQATPSDKGVVLLQPGTLTTVNMQAGQHLSVRKLDRDGSTLEVADNVVAVRHGDALHLRYADGSTASFEGFFSICSENSVCSVNLTSDDASGITLSGAYANGGVADDGLLVYAHGRSEVLMAMAEEQPSLVSALLGLEDMELLTYLPPEPTWGVVGLIALGAGGLIAASDNHAVSTNSANGTNGTSGTTGTSTTAQALNAIRDAAQNNTAGDSTTGQSVYVAAGVSHVTATNLGAINSALNSLAVTGAQADTTPEVQAIVDAYNTVLASADGRAGNALTPITAEQYSTLGVTGVTGTVSAGSALFLLDDTVDASRGVDVDTVIELQQMADAAARVMAAAGGTTQQGNALRIEDLAALGIAGVTTNNLPAVLTAINSTVPDTAIDTQDELQRVVNTALSTLGAALNQIAAAADANNASPTSPNLSVYTAAAVTGVSSTNLPEISSALDSLWVTGAQANTTAKVQTIVNAYNAILASADGQASNTTTPLTGAQYSAIGVTGVVDTAAPGNALFLLNDTVDAIALTEVDTVPEVQNLADAASHVIAGAAGGAAPSLLDLAALDISGVTAINLPLVQAAIAATADNGTGVDTRAELQALVNAIIAGNTPHMTSLLAGVTNLDVTSNLVVSVDQSLRVGTGFIHITDMGGPGYLGDTSANTQNIDVATAIANQLLTITGTGANTKIVINPLWDLDLASNYQLSMDDGAFLNASDGTAAAHFATVNFSTVAPGTHSTGTAASEAMASQAMVDATGAMTASKRWLSIEGLGNNTGSITQLGDLSTGAFALVMKNYATAPGGPPASGGNGSDGIATHDTNVGLVNFGTNDWVYFDSQVNNASIQLFDPRYTGMTDGSNVGGLAGQNTLVMGLVSTPQQQGSTAMISLGLEGNTANTIYASIVSLPDGTVGWANVWHTGTAAVLMG